MQTDPLVGCRKIPGGRGRSLKQPSAKGPEWRNHSALGRGWGAGMPPACSSSWCHRDIRQSYPRQPRRLTQESREAASWSHSCKAEGTLGPSNGKVLVVQLPSTLPVPT